MFSEQGYRSMYTYLLNHSKNVPNDLFMHYYNDDICYNVYRKLLKEYYMSVISKCTNDSLPVKVNYHVVMNMDDVPIYYRKYYMRHKYGIRT